MVNPRVVKALKRNLLTILTLVAVLLSIIIGLSMRASHPSYSPRVVMYVNFIGDLFLRMIRAVTLPLIISSIIAAIAPLDISLSKKIGTHAITYIICTTLISATIGIMLVTTIKPGGSIDKIEADGQRKGNTIIDTVLDLIRNVFPPNIVQATLQAYQTVLIPPENNTEASVYDWTISSRYIDGTNMLGVISVSVIFAITLSTIRSKTAKLIEIILEFTLAMMKIIQFLIWLTPIAVFFLILAKFLEMEDIGELFSKVGLYLGTIAIGMFLQGFVFLPILYFGFTRKNPFKFIGHIGSAILTAFGTSSSLATLPVSLKCVEENAGIDTRVSRFMLPLGATINMNGTALYESVAAIFVAQMVQIDLSIGQIITVALTATAASVGTAGVPQAALVTLVMVLDTIGIPAQDVSLVIASDWIVGRLSTMVNVMGDTYGAAVIESTSEKELHKLTMKAKKREEEAAAANGDVEVASS
ncbi:excitatory amino acid transporter 3-like [Chironomus tepperi]|uniref:excitatory amino acid transporter 3-like n=1 Tax=Chironomus tepperi TaxID=113505 RepID=UPI00391F6AE4